MKTLPALIVILMSINVVVSAQTNNHYITEEIHTNAIFVPTTQQIEQAKQAKESRPAKEDHEGNWGTISEGFQLSIRLAKGTFTNGEPIVASVLLRNVADKPLIYFVSSPYDTEQKLILSRNNQQLVGKDEITTNMTFKERLSHIHSGKSWNAKLSVGTQRKFVVELTSFFNLSSNGEYSIRVKRNVLKLDLTGKAEVVSKNAVFRIAD